MIGHVRWFNRLALAAMLYGLLCIPARAEDNPKGLPGEPDALPALQTGDNQETEEVLIEQPPTESSEDVHTLMGTFAGYRFFHTDGFGGRAAEYEYLHSSPSFGGMYNRLGKNLKFAVEGDYLNIKDYYGDLLTDFRGEYRVHLRTESLFHNLDHEQLGGGAPYVLNDQAPGEQYGVRVEQDLAGFRYKLHDYPLHVNLTYWRMLKEGSAQLRFADTMFEYTGTNTVNAASRNIDQQTHEGNLGFDAHLGPVDIVYNFKIREFHDHAATPRDFYVARSPLDPANPNLPGGVQEHNEYPDSRFYDHTIKLHTSLAGGIVGAASYSFSRRENLSSLSDIRGADQSHDTLQNAAGDFVYTPCKEFSLALKYRRQEVDRDNAATLFSLVDSSTINVRPSLDWQKDTVIATVSVRALNALTFKGEYKGDFLHRGNVASWDMPLAKVSQNLPEDSAVHKGTVTVLSRPLKGLLLKAQYGYSAAINPSYGNSFGEKHDGQLFATYNSPNRWGASANYRITRESNDQLERSTIPHTFNTSNFVQVDTPLTRGKDADTATVNLWYTPCDRLTINGSYGFLRTRIDQGVLFEVLTLAPPAAAGSTSYTAQAQIFSINSVYRFDEKLDLSLALQQVRSFSEFSPDPVTFSPTKDTSGISQISHTDTVESSLLARTDYHLSKNLSCALEYSYRDYDEKIHGLFNGTVQTIMANVSGKW